MFSFLLFVIMLSVFCKLFSFAVKAAWGIGKIIFSLVVPFVIVGLIIAGIVHLIIPVLVIVAVLYLVNRVVTEA